MDLGLKDKKALVLSASQGIGFAIAEALSSEGVRLAIASKNEDRLARASEKTGAKLKIAADLYDPSEARRVVNETIHDFGGLDVLVINAGGPPKGSIEALSIDDWKKGTDGLLFAAIEAVKAALPSMRVQKYGRIIIMTSVSAQVPLDHLSISNVIRAGISGLVKSVSNEVAKDGITVNAVLPGYTATENVGPYLSEGLLEKIPAGRYAEADEHAALVAFLASKHAGYITGQSIISDGGLSRRI